MICASLQPVDADTAAHVIVALATGLLLKALLDPDGADWRQVAVDGLQMLLSGIAHPGEATLP